MSLRVLFEIAAIFKMESDRAEPLACRRSSGMRRGGGGVCTERFEAGLSPRDRCCVEEGGVEESSFLAAV